MNQAVAPNYIQAERILRVETPLGMDVLLAEKLEAREKVNGLFEFQVSVRSKQVDLKPDQLVGKLVDISLETGAGSRRTWNGLVISLTAGPPVTRGMRAYQLTVVPQHWLMTQRSDCRIWLDKTSIEIAEILCQEHGLHAPVTAGILEPPKPQHYSVQWNETDLAYLTRRLEEDGIFYWFEHEGGEAGSVAAKHTLHIASDKFGYTEGDDGDVRYAMGSTDRNHISKFEQTFRFVPGKRSAGDWNFLQPNSVPRSEALTLHSLPGNADYDLYEFPAIGGYGSGSASEGVDADRVGVQSKLRMQAAEVEHERVEGQSNVRTLTPGRRFKPYDVANAAAAFEEHVILEIAHYVHDRSYETSPDELDYVNTFVAIPSRVPATPHRTTRRPRIEGSQIAIVAGPSGEEIHTDSHARVKVWFPWDRRAKKDGSDTCWIRVAQNWAGGSTYGGQIVPRMNMEAVVSYLDGDPDKPLVTGIVPNPNSNLPYEYPANKTRSTFRTNSYKSNGFNEFTFEDKTGAENMFFHAQKDHTSRVLNTRTARVDNHDVYSVGGNRAVEVAKNEKREIGGSLNMVVGGTGPAAVGALAGVMGLTGHTAGLLKQAGDIAGGGGLPLTGFIGTLASTALGFLSSGGLKSRERVVSGPSPRADAGVDLAASGTGMGDDAGGFFSLPGIMNTIVQSFQSTSVGVAQVEQIGMSKVVNVGATSLESVGKFKKTAVGEEYVIEVGDSKLIMKSNGEVIILGKKFNFIATEHFQMRGKPIDLN